LAETIGADGIALLHTLCAPETPAHLRVGPAVAVLRRIWLQPYWTDTGPGRGRQEAELPPTARLIVSPYDPDARFGIKRAIRWTGSKGHRTEPCDAETPHRIPHGATTPATPADVALTATLQRHLAERDLAPQEPLVDTGDGDAERSVPSRPAHQMEWLGPVLPETRWHARAGQGFELACVHGDWDARQGTCPRGRQSRSWRPGHDTDGQAIIHVWFAHADCAAGAVRPQCPKAETRPRTMKLCPQAQHEALQAARQQQTTAALKSRYAQRARGEGTIAQGVRRCALRQARYRGLAKTPLQHVLTAVAMNLMRLLAWGEERPKAQTRHSRFSAVLQATVSSALAYT
jgi:transposase